MRVTLSILAIVVCSLPAQAQKLTKKIPSNLLTTNSILLLSSKENEEKIGQFIKEDLEKLGIKIIKIVSVEQNPVHRKKQYEKLQEELKDQNIGNSITVDVLTFHWRADNLGGIVREKTKTVLAAMPWTDPYGEVYLVKEKNYDKMLQKLEGDIDKHLK